MNWTATIVVTVLACALCIAADHWIHVGLSGRSTPTRGGNTVRVQRVEVPPQETRERDDDESPPAAPRRKAA